MVLSRGAHSDDFGKTEAAFLAEAGRAQDYARWIRWPVPAEDHANGVPFTWDLAGPQGAAFTLIAPPGTDALRIKHAETWLRDRRDVASICILRIKKIIP